MSNDHDRRRDLSKLRTIALSDATHRRLRLYCHGLHEDGEAGETIARVAGEAIGAWLDRQEGRPEVTVTLSPRTSADVAADVLRQYAPEIKRAKEAIMADAMANAEEREAGDPSEGEAACRHGSPAEVYARWRGGR